MKSLMISAKNMAKELLYQFECPAHLRANHRNLTERDELPLTQSLIENFFTSIVTPPKSVESYLSTDEGRRGLYHHLSGRLTSDRRNVVPWIDNTIRLKGAKILEIGCGTGSSTVALAEQGAQVIAADVHEGSLRVASDRIKAHGLTAELFCSNANDIFEQLGRTHLDMVVFIAVLEHMTLDERLKVLSDAWAMLPSGGCLIVQETPNRFWFIDEHTSQDHFFMWLPDDVAIRYSSRTPREIYNRSFIGPDYQSESTRLKFTRWGRGVSYHDFVLAFNIQPSQLPIVSCMELFARQKTLSGRIKRNTVWRRYEKFLSSTRPEIHPGFFLRNLDLIYRKL